MPTDFQTPSHLNPRQAPVANGRDSTDGGEPEKPGGSTGVPPKPKAKPKGVPKAKTPVQEATGVFWLHIVLRLCYIYNLSNFNFGGIDEYILYIYNKKKNM